VKTSNGKVRDDEDLIHKLRSGNEQAFRWLVETFKNRIYHTVLNIIQNEDEAEDVTQEVFISVHQSINSFRADSTLSTWMYRIAIRKSLDGLRKRKTRQALTKWLPSWIQGDDKYPGVDFYHPGIAIENKEQAAILFNAISRLPERQRIAFTLIKVEKISYRDAEEVMEQSVKAIESLVSRAKENLQSQLKDYYYERDK
jgi:RNA polymerase sigma factor (sigma-70 family)